jgi:hypothetical protein
MGIRVLVLGVALALTVASWLYVTSGKLPRTWPVRLWVGAFSAICLAAVV